VSLVARHQPYLWEIGVRLIRLGGSHANGTAEAPRYDPTVSLVYPSVQRMRPSVAQRSRPRATHPERDPTAFQVFLPRADTKGDAPVSIPPVGGLDTLAKN